MYHAGTYIPAATLLHRLDPRIKIFFVVALSIIILIAKPVAALLIGLTLFLPVIVCRISLKIIGQALRPLLFFIVMIFLVHTFFTEGDSFFAVPYINLSLTRTGLTQGLLVSWKFLCLITAALLLTMTTQPSLIIAALKFYLQPLKLLRIEADNIAVMIMLALRLMPMLLDEKDRRETAQKARGYESCRAGFYPRIKAFLALTVSILLNVLKKAEELAVAMESRNYRIGPRSSIVELKLSGADFAVLSIFCFFLVIFMALNSSFS